MKNQAFLSAVLPIAMLYFLGSRKFLWYGCKWQLSRGKQSRAPVMSLGQVCFRARQSHFPGYLQ